MGRHLGRVWSLLAGASSLAGIAAAWWLALPRYEVCIAIYPAPPGCGVSRVTPAIIWTLAISIATLIGLAAIARNSRANTELTPWVGPVVFATVAAMNLLGYYLVLRS